VRALSTAELAVAAGEWACAIVTSPDLYASDPERVLEVLAGVDPKVEQLLITGHEPTWSGLVGRLIGGGRIRMPTAAVACLDLPHGSWADLSKAVCELRWLVTPKMLQKN
jgi:phosphohistidine phosphatase